MAWGARCAAAMILFMAGLAIGPAAAGQLLVDTHSDAVHVGEPVVITGIAFDTDSGPIAGVDITVRFESPAQPDAPVHVLTDSSGAFSVTFTARPSPGSYGYRVFAHDNASGQATAAEGSVPVSPAPKPPSGWDAFTGSLGGFFALVVLLGGGGPIGVLIGLRIGRRWKAGRASPPANQGPKQR